VTRTSSEGSKRLNHIAAELGAEAMSERGLTPKEIEQRRERARDLNLSQYLPKGYHGPWWKPEDLALLGTRPDEEVARRTGRTVGAVRQKRERMGIPNPTDSPRVGPRPRWTPTEDKLALTLSIREAAERTGRTKTAVRGRRHLLKIQRRR
jgi:hypothetical protein